jgi:DNA-binding GntR family transcriptional regulator
MNMQVIEECLGTLYEALQEQKQETVSAAMLVERLGMSSAPAASLLDKLASMRLVTCEPRHNTKLTPTGHKIALELLRHRRQVELLLDETLGGHWNQTRAELPQVGGQAAAMRKASDAELALLCSLSELVFPLVSAVFPAGPDCSSSREGELLEYDQRRMR